MVPSSNASTHGTADPYSKRSAISLLSDTLPEIPRTSRTIWEVVVPNGMKSVSSTDPPAVSKRVIRISVPSRYLRETLAGSLGARRQRPCSRFPSSAAKQALELKRGQHSQSIEPSRLTSAAVIQLLMKA